MTDYILQRDGSCCGLIALLNALRFLGRPTPAPGEAEYEDLVDLARCRHGSIIDEQGVAEHLGLSRVATTFDDIGGHFPVALRVLNPERAGMHMHGTLVVGEGGDGLTLVNYRWRTGPVVETVARGAVALPVAHNREAWELRLR